MAKILLVPDIFFHRWDQADGELWLCLRPFVKKDEFAQWAADPHGSGHQFELPASGDGGVLCRPSQELRSINLPTSVDIWLRVIRGPRDPAAWLRIARKQGCRTDPGIVDQELQDDLGLGNQPLPFVHLFNESVRVRFAKATAEEKAALPEWLELRLESGKAVAGKFGSHFKSLYRNEADAAKPAIPFFRPQGRWSTQFTADEVIASNLFWFNGLMLPLGVKPVATDIASITAVDIWLADSAVDLNATEPPELGSFKISLPQLAAQPSPPYFSRIVDSYLAGLVCSLEDPTALNVSMLASSQDRIDAQDPVAYFSPAIQGFQKSTDGPLTDCWEFVSRMGAQSTQDLGLGRSGSALLGRHRLVDMAGIEVRSSSTVTTGTALEVTPGVLVTGQIRPYRRFPRITDKGTYLPTVMTFEPAGDGADILESIEGQIGTEGPGGLKAAFAQAVVSGGWKLQLLSAARLPWDGPRKVYRILAVRPGDSPSIDGAARTCEPQSATLALRAPFSLKTEPGRYTPEDRLVRWLWKPDGSITTVDALRSSWNQRFGSWARLPVNALFITGGAGLAAELDALFLGDYNFFQANSRTRLEQILGVNVRIPNQTPTNCDPNQDPAQDFEDDLSNFNTASALTRQGELLDTRVRFAQISSGSFRGLNRRQVIPFVFEWPNAPMNDRGEDPKARVPWQRIRQYVKSILLEPLDAEPFGARVEHTYCSAAPAIDEQGQPILMRRSLAFDWVPDLPTSAETLDSKDSDSAKPARFLEARYESGDILLDFHPYVLDPGSSQLATLEELDQRTLAIRAWRSVGEMLRSESLALRLDLRLFDMVAQTGGNTAGAATFAKTGFTGHWRDALREIAHAPIPLPSAERQRLVTWCTELLSATKLPRTTFTLRVPVDSADTQIGNIAHVARVRLELARAADHAPPATMRLVPITQQPTLGAAARHSLWSAWAQVGFDRGSDLARVPQDEQERLRAAFKNWIWSLRAADDSVSPVVRPSMADASARSAAIRADTQALVSELPGTDWFTPAGSPQSSTPLDAQLTVLPMGFAPCARHPQLGRASQPVVQRALVHLNDAIDVAYESWARNTAMDWQGLFSGLAALATPGAATGDWAGPLPDLVQAIVAGLLRPQPDPQSTQVDPNVRLLIHACLDASTPAGQSSLAVSRILLEAPAVFADSKALILSRVDFVPSTQSKRTPPANTLARAQFTRLVRPQSTEVRAKGKPTGTAQAALVESVVGWKHMIAAGLDGESGPDMRLGFIEFLDDARYDNAFSVRADGQMLEAFEDLVDARGPVKAKARDRGSWSTRPPIVPGSAENVPEVIDREVRLASRAPIEPPELLWSGSSDALAAALGKVSIGQTGWAVSRLSRGEPPTVAASGADGLEIAAYRRLPDQWNQTPYADEVLVHFVYRVTGDEEATSAGSTDAFYNDGFFVECLRYQDQAVNAFVGRPASVLDAPTETILRRFATTARGTADAAQIALEHLVTGTSIYGHLKDLIRTEKANDIPSTSVVLRPIAVGSSGGEFCVGGGVSDIRDRVRDVCLLRPVTGEPNSTAYLVVGIMLDVWTGWDIKLTQGRNIPFEQWDARCRLASGRVPAPFDPIFWQAAAQSSRPTTQHVNKVLRNRATHWGENNRTFKVRPAWYGMKVSSKTVLDQLLFSDSLDVGGRTKPSKTILRPDRSQLAYSVPFGITIYQEQFESGRDKPREVRFPFPTVFCDPASVASTLIEFPDEYVTFSVDIRWRKPDGSAPLILERIFAMPDDS